MIRTVDWFTLFSEETPIAKKIGSFELSTTRGGEWRCPKCGNAATYVEATIDQDFMGNDIVGWWWDCYECGIGTEPIEGYFNDRD